MKPPPFAYAAPEQLEEVLDLLSREGSEAKVLAGGQSLMPLLNMRLARPSLVVDLGRVPDLDGIAEGPEGVRLGAMVRHRTLERDPRVARALPLLAEAASQVGHAAIRTRGTLGGSLVHADPAAEYPAVAVLHEAVMTLRSAGGERQVPADQFFVTYLTTDVAPDEVLTSVLWPRLPQGSGTAFLEMARRHGDFALVAVAAAVRLAEDGSLAEVRLSLSGVGGTPVRARRAEAGLAGHRPEGSWLEDAAAWVREEVEPEGDLHASAEFRRHLAGEFTRRALKLALERAKGGAGAWTGNGTSH